MIASMRRPRLTRPRDIRSARPAVAGLLGLVLAAGCGAGHQAGASPGHVSVLSATTLKAEIAHDKAAIARRYHNCSALHLSPPHCPFKVATTANGKGGDLIAVDLTQQTGDDCYRGRVFFFDNESYLTSTRRLAPRSFGGVKGVRADGPARFAVTYWVSASATTSCAMNGNAGTDGYVYGWNGTHMFKKSGRPPKPPKVIVGT